MQIIWLGQVHNIGRLGQRRPQIEVVLRPADDSNAPTLTRLVPAAFVRALRLGDVWQGPNLVGVSPSPPIQLQRLEVSGDATKVLPVGRPVDGVKGRYLLDFRSFADHAGHTGSYAVREQLPDGRWLVVPCWELLRFYFGASGALASRLLSGPLAARSLFRSIRHDPAQDVHWLDLAPGMHSTSASTVARIALDRRAASAARWISNSGTAALANGQPYYPKTNFPFAGQTNLTVHGRWLKCGDEAVLFVERLVSCTHPFPFRQLHYSIPQRTVAIARGFSKTVTSHAPTARKQELREAPLRANAAASVIHLPEQTAMAFPDLLFKTFKRVRPRPSAMHGAREQPASAQVLADGSELAASGFPEVELASQDESRLDEAIEPEALDVLQQAVGMLQSEGVVVQLQPLGGQRVPELIPLGDVVSDAGPLGKAFGCIGISRTGVRTKMVYCLMRTDSHLQTETALLLYAVPRSTTPYDALRQAVGVLRDGRVGSTAVISAPEFVATNPAAVSGLIKRIAW